MSLSGLIPADLSGSAAATICAIAFIAATARGFSGFGSALIFMPLASSVAPPRLAAALLLIIDFVATAPLLPGAWQKADRKATAIIAAGALIGVPVGTYLLSRLDPLTTRWIISGFVFALLFLLLSGWRYRGKDHLALSIGIGTLSGFCSGLAQTGGPPIVGYWLGRPIPTALARANILLFFGASDLFSVVSYALSDLITALGACGRPGLCARNQVRHVAVRSRQRKSVPRDMLWPDRARGDLRPTYSRRCAARSLSLSS